MGPVKMHAELARSLHGQFPLRLASLATSPAPRRRSHVPPIRDDEWMRARSAQQI